MNWMLARRIVSSLTLVLLGLAPVWRYGLDEGSLVFTCSLIVAGALIYGRVTAAQLAWRAVVWLCLCYATVLSAFGYQSETEVAAGMAWACVVALLVMGWHGLEGGAESAFKPNAFRITMSLSILLALADATVFMIPAATGLRSLVVHGHVRHLGVVLLVLLNGGTLLLGAWLMYRLRVVGVVLALLGNVGMLVWTAAIHMHDGELPPFVWLCVLANVGVQIALQAPLLHAMLRGVARSEGVERAARYVAPSVLLCMLALCTVGAFISLRPILGVH